MPVGIHTDPVTKAKVIAKIRDEGISVPEASKLFSINTKTIYRWLKEGVVDGNKNLILENNRLKKELEQAYRVLGRLTTESQRPKG